MGLPCLDDLDQPALHARGRGRSGVAVKRQFPRSLFPATRFCESQLLAPQGPRLLCTKCALFLASLLHFYTKLQGIMNTHQYGRIVCTLVPAVDLREQILPTRNTSSKKD